MNRSSKLLSMLPPARAASFLLAGCVAALVSACEKSVEPSSTAAAPSASQLRDPVRNGAPAEGVTPATPGSATTAPTAPTSAAPAVASAAPVTAPSAPGADAAVVPVGSEKRREGEACVMAAKQSNCGDGLACCEVSVPCTTPPKQEDGRRIPTSICGIRWTCTRGTKCPPRPPLPQ